MCLKTQGQFIYFGATTGKAFTCWHEQWRIHFCLVYSYETKNHGNFLIFEKGGIFLKLEKIFKERNIFSFIFSNENFSCKFVHLLVLVSSWYMLSIGWVFYFYFYSISVHFMSISDHRLNLELTNQTFLRSISFCWPRVCTRGQQLFIYFRHS